MMTRCRCTSEFKSRVTLEAFILVQKAVDMVGVNAPQYGVCICRLQSLKTDCL